MNWSFGCHNHAGHRDVTTYLVHACAVLKVVIARITPDRLPISFDCTSSMLCCLPCAHSSYKALQLLCPHSSTFPPPYHNLSSPLSSPFPASLLYMPLVAHRNLYSPPPPFPFITFVFPPLLQEPPCRCGRCRRCGEMQWWCATISATCSSCSCSALLSGKQPSWFALALLS